MEHEGSNGDDSWAIWCKTRVLCRSPCLSSAQLEVINFFLLFCMSFDNILPLGGSNFIFVPVVPGCFVRPFCFSLGTYITIFWFPGCLQFCLPPLLSHGVNVSPEYLARSFCLTCLTWFPPLLPFPFRKCDACGEAWWTLGWRVCVC